MNTYYKAIQPNVYARKFGLSGDDLSLQNGKVLSFYSLKPKYENDLYEYEGVMLVQDDNDRIFIAMPDRNNTVSDVTDEIADYIGEMA